MEIKSGMMTGVLAARATEAGAVASGALESCRAVATAGSEADDSGEATSLELDESRADGCSRVLVAIDLAMQTSPTRSSASKRAAPALISLLLMLLALRSNRGTADSSDRNSNNAAAKSTGIVTAVSGEAASCLSANLMVTADDNELST